MASDGERSAFRVRAPREGDAIGFALRNAFDRDLGLPDDMAMMLQQLDGATDNSNRQG